MVFIIPPFRNFRFILVVMVIFLTNACAPKRDLVYFSDLSASKIPADPQNENIKLKTNDLLNITVNSLSPEADRLFSGNQNAVADVSAPKIGYRINKEGVIRIPITGDIKVQGMSIDEARQNITERLSRQLRSPSVDLTLLNFRVTVIGEVNKPSTFTVTDDKINVLEALGFAGDMTAYGKRSNVLVIRNENGEKIIKRLDLNKEESLRSPYFYLRQNDIVYVEPDKAKAFEYSQNTRVLPIVIASISAAAVLLAVILRR